MGWYFAYKSFQVPKSLKNATLAPKSSTSYLAASQLVVASASESFPSPCYPKVNVFTVEGNRIAICEMENSFILIFENVNLRKQDQTELKMPKLVGELVVPCLDEVRSETAHDLLKQCWGGTGAPAVTRISVWVPQGTCASPSHSFGKAEVQVVKKNSYRSPLCAFREFGLSEMKVLAFCSAWCVSILSLMTNATVCS